VLETLDGDEVARPAATSPSDLQPASLLGPSVREFGKDGPTEAEMKAILNLTCRRKYAVWLLATAVFILSGCARRPIQQRFPNPDPFSRNIFVCDPGQECRQVPTFVDVPKGYQCTAIEAEPDAELIVCVKQ
jgi:hypothetical protein